MRTQWEFDFKMDILQMGHHTKILKVKLFVLQLSSHHLNPLVCLSPTHQDTLHRPQANQEILQPGASFSSTADRKSLDTRERLSEERPLKTLDTVVNHTHHLKKWTNGRSKLCNLFWCYRETVTPSAEPGSACPVFWSQIIMLWATETNWSWTSTGGE